MKTSATVLLAWLLMLGGCGGCQKNEPTSTATPSKAAAQPQAVAPTAPVAPAGQAQPAGQQPPAAAATGGEAAEEDDCLVIADANPDYGPPPLAVAFTAEAECTKGEPTYKWDFGDGSTSTEANPSHTYNKAGDFTATVTVTAGSANANDEIDITVEEDAEPETP